MNEPYKSCWECKMCDDLKEHLTICTGFASPTTPKITRVARMVDLDRVMEENRRKLKA